MKKLHGNVHHSATFIILIFSAANAENRSTGIKLQNLCHICLLATYGHVILPEQKKVLKFVFFLSVCIGVN